MSTSFSRSNIKLDRKSLKKPDEFLAVLRKFFSPVVNNSRHFFIAFAAAVVLALGVFAYLKVLENKSEQAMNALYLAQKQVQLDFDAMLQSKNTNKADKSNKEAQAKENALAAAFYYESLDVNQEYSKSLALFENVQKEYSGTDAAFEAKVALGNLYQRHQQLEKALVSFNEALEQTSNRTEKAYVYFAVATVQEDLGKSEESLKTLREALLLNNEQIKGDLLLAIARNHELLKDQAKAKEVYTQVVEELKGSTYAKAAELYLGQLDR